MVKRIGIKKIKQERRKIRMKPLPLELMRASK